MLNLNNFNHKYIAVIFVTAIFVLSLIAGYNSGKNKSRSEFVFNLQEQIQIGLNNFYLDQDRFPSLDEFFNQGIMLNYFSSILSQSPKSKNCSENFVYKKLSNSSYQLDFCLDTDLNNYKKGWNQVVVNK
jgi:hypothetical protein